MTEAQIAEIRESWSWFTSIWKIRLSRLIHGEASGRGVSDETLLLFDLVRDYIVSERRLAWIAMARSERHLIYKAVAERVLCSNPGDDPDACEAFAVIMMFRDDVLHVERELFPRGRRKDPLRTIAGLTFPYPRP